jgi:hypothetical protein
MSDEQKPSSIPSIPNIFDDKTSDNLKPSDIGVTNNVDKNQMNGINDFLESNSLVAKFAFLLFVIFIFIILLSFSINIISWLFSSANKQKLINGMIDASSQMLTFTQDPNIYGSKTIYRSNNANGGIEFTWSVWIYINDLDTSSRKYKHVFSKGNYAPDIDGINQPNNAPGLYISKDTNSIIVIMNTFNVIDEQLEIPDIPLNKWVNVIIICRNKILDVYINGIITKSLTLVGVPKQNYGDVYVAINGGFNGYISNLWYYSHALGILAIQELVKKGPNTIMTDNSAMNLKNPNYLSLRWYFNGSNNEYNS